MMKENNVVEMNAIKRIVEKSVGIDGSARNINLAKTVLDLDEKLKQTNESLQEAKAELCQSQKVMHQTYSRVRQLLEMRKAGALQKTDSELVEDIYQRLVLENRSIFEVI